MERELSLTSMLAVALKRARLILAWTLALGVIGAGYGLYKNAAARAVTAESGGSTTALYETDVAAAKRALARSQEQTEQLLAYMDNSLYYAVDPYNKGVGSLLLLVDTGYQIQPELSYQDPDKTEQVVAAYTELYTSDGEIIDGVASLLGQDIDAKYILELIDVTGEGGLVRISVTHADAGVAAAIAQYIYEATEAAVQSAAMPHTVRVLASYQGYEIDTDMLARHDAATETLKLARAELTQRREALTELLENPQTGDQPAAWASAAKFGVLGLIVGLIIGCCIAVFGSQLSGRVESGADIAACGDIPLLGTLPSRKKRWFDQTIRRLEGDSAADFEQAARVTAASLAAAAGDKPVVLIGTPDRAELSRLADMLGEGTSVGGNILTDADAVYALGDEACIVLVEKRGQSYLQQIERQLLRLKTLEKEPLGVILL